MRTQLALTLLCAGPMIAQAPLELSRFEPRFVPRDTAGRVVAGDFDGDGDADAFRLGSPSFGAPGPALLRNEGGRLIEVPLPVLPGAASDAAFADFDGDGDADLLITYVEFANQLYRNDGTGSFTLAQDFAFVSPTVSLTVGDVDGDGDLDFVAGNKGNLGFANGMRLNDGSGRFSAVPFARYPTPIERTESVDLVDIDGDNDLDLVEGGAATRIYINDGTGNYRDESAARVPAAPTLPTRLLTDDFDGDGFVDLLRERVLLNDGTGTFQPFGPELSSLRVRLATDIDGDGDPDILTDGGSAFLFENNGDATFVDRTATRIPTRTPVPSEFFAFDFFARGIPDLVIRGSGHLELFVNDGAGTFSRAEPPAAQRSSLPLSAGTLTDLDGDGDLDALASARSSGDLIAWLNDGFGNLIDAGSFSAGPTSRDLVAGDFNGDGDIDAFVVTSTIPTRSVLLTGTGNGSFHPPVSSAVPLLPGSYSTAAAGDIDSDGDLDVVLCGVTSFGSNPRINRILLNDGSGSFVEAPPTALPANNVATTDLVLLDVEGDGDLDLIFANAMPAASELWLNDGAGSFTAAPTAQWPAPASVTFVDASDLDGDGDLDVVFGGEPSPSAQPPTSVVEVLENDGTGRFVALSRSTFVGTATEGLALADLDEDGHADLILAGGLESSVLLSGSAIGFSTVDATFAVDAILLDPSAGDIDRDGDLDILGVGNGMSTWRNLRRHVHTPRPAVGGAPFEVELSATGHEAPQLAAVIVGTGRALGPQTPFGTLLLDPLELLFTTGPVAIDPSLGRATIDFTMSPAPVWVGVELELQAAFAHGGGIRPLFLSNVDGSRIY